MTTTITPTNAVFPSQRTKSVSSNRTLRFSIVIPLG